MKLWIDDQHDDPATPNRHPPVGYLAARSSLEAIKLTLAHGMPEAISFDHDLGDEDNAMVYLDWLIAEMYSLDIPEYTVHSENPVGRENIISKMESWRYSKNLK